MAKKKEYIPLTPADKLRITGIDLVKVAAVSGALAYIGISQSCAKELPSEIGLSISDFSNLEMATLAFDVGAGAFAGYTRRYAAPALVYTATIIPELAELLTAGDLAHAGKMFLAKTIVAGGAYALGHIYRDM